MPLLVRRLNRDAGQRDDVKVLQDAFGPLRFVHLHRRDVVARAVSWARADQTGYWQQGDTQQGQPHLDLDQIDHLVAAIHEHNEGWRPWFAAQCVQPLDLTYESVVATPADAVTRVLDFIGTVSRSDWEPASPHLRQADEINDEWVRRYRSHH